MTRLERITRICENLPTADCRPTDWGLGTWPYAGAPFELRAIINHDDRFTGRFTRTADDNLATAVLRFF